MLDAMMSAASERGYGALTVADVVERARVSRRTFYEHFADKEACFLAAYDAGVEALLEHMHRAVGLRRTEDWRVWTRASIEAYLEMLEAEPNFAWALHVEVFAAGAAAHARRAQVIARFAAQWRRLYVRARRDEPSLAPVPADPLLRTIVVGHEELVRERLRASGLGSLHELTDPAEAIALRVFGVSP